MQQSELSTAKCILLHTRHLSEYKQILDCFSEEYGRISFVLNLKRQPLLPNFFRLLQVEFRGQQELKTLVSFSYQQQPYHIQGRLQVIGLYLNELIYHFTKAFDVHPGLLASYMRCVAHLSLHKNFGAAVRQFELQFLALVGFAIDFQFDSQQQIIQTQQLYRFEALSGFVCIKQRQNKAINGADIIAIAQIIQRDNLEDSDDKSTQYKILSYILKNQIDTLLAREGKKIQSRQLWIS